MPGWLTIVLVLAGIGYTVVRRAIGEPLAARDLLATPVILLVLGVHQVADAGHPAAGDWFWLAVTSVTGLAFGLLRGSTVRLLVKDGVLWQRYPGRAYAVWVLSLIVNGGLAFLATSTGMNGDLRSIPLSIGVSLLGEALAVGARALATGLPFAPTSTKSFRGPRPTELPDAPTVRQALTTLTTTRR
ncbi:DUF1453 domain-containing protein [Amycolatopsis magusensis]|uniref:DUF1453 domain-containing protein n=1 Tax=Amycolatopsis magusensis TaxID=882444 RepID=UPI0024A8DA7A|nr:DUF1453 domain-containing protein [Amycolatopsis magusensis]MDI5981040.1 DUF1453 domain-containing protein [Amycolatopsis magusensis]